MYFVDNQIYDNEDNLIIYRNLAAIDNRLGIIQDDPIYEVTLTNPLQLTEGFEDILFTKYSNLIFGKRLTSKDLADAGYVLVRDLANRVVHYYNKNNGTERSFKYADQVSNHE